MKEIEARGLLCPKPIIMAKMGLEKVDAVNIFVNEEALEDLGKLAKKLNSTIEVTELKEDEYSVVITKIDGAEVVEEEGKEGVVVLIGSNKMGEGKEEELGLKLMNALIYTISETKPYPAAVIFYNSGVYLTSEGSTCIEDIKKLEANGVEIMSCGVCLNYHEIQDKLQVGISTNMYTIYEKVKNASNTVVF